MNRYYPNDIVENLNYKSYYNTCKVGSRWIVDRECYAYKGEYNLRMPRGHSASDFYSPHFTQIMLYRRPLKNWIKYYRDELKQLLSILKWELILNK